MQDKQKDRRASPRRPIKLAAQLVHPAGRTWPCQIADFCAEGLFIRYSVDTSRQLDAQPSAPDHLLVRFREPDGRHIHELGVQVVRRIDQAMGVMFTRSNLDAFQAMLRLCGADEELAPASISGQNNKAQFIVRQCARHVVRAVEPLMPDFFAALETQLGEAARQAGSDTEANELMDAAMQIRSRQRPFWLQMVKGMEAPVRAQEGGEQMQLVDKGEFEDWLMVRVLVTKAETQYRGSLLQLKMRLEHAGIVNETGHQNPLGPVMVCEAFSHALDSLGFSREVARIAFKVFEHQIIRQLDGLYEELNQILVRQGILPDLDLSKYLSDHKNGSTSTERKQPPVTALKPAAAPSSQPAAPRPDTGRQEESFRNYHAQAESAFSTVRTLLGSLKKAQQSLQPTPAPFPENAEPLNTQEMDSQLDALQHKAAVTGEADERGLRERIYERVREMGERGLDERQQASVDVVDRFFAGLVDSTRLSDHARSQIKKLEVPLLKVVMENPAFFEDMDSPVRATFNRIAELGLRGSRPNPVTRKRVDELIQRINRDFDRDTEVFDQALGQLNELIERQNLVYRRNVERVTAAAEGQQKVQEARRAVNTELEQRLGNRQVPKAVATLIQGGWRDLLSLTYIRQGGDSQLYQDYLTVIDTLMAFGDDPHVPVNLKELLRIIQEGLASVSSNHIPSGHIRDELKRFLVDHDGGPVERVSMPPMVDKEDRDQARRLAEVRDRRLQRWMNRAQRMVVGDWVRYQPEGSREIQPMRLVWIARGQSRFVFVNHQGMKVVERDLVQLANELQQGMIVPDPGYDRPVVDEGVDRMVQQVYEQMSWMSTHDELTGLLTRREFERMLAHSLDREGAHGENALVQIELRHFRLLNDTAGYEAGDDAVKQVAAVIKATVGEPVPVARTGNTRFALLLPAGEAEEQAHTLVRRIGELDLAYGGREYTLGANAGLADSAPGLATAERWLRAAEEALEEAMKLSVGALQIYFMDASHLEQQAKIARKVAGMNALDEDRLLLRCQRIIPLHNKTAMGLQHEVLISLYDDQGHLITAAEFVRTAEHYERMHMVDRWVVGYMLDWLARHPQALESLGGVCINLSGHSLNDEELLEFIYDKLSKQDAPIERMWFEITEAAAIQRLADVAEFIQGIQELGCRFCLGNFGTGPLAYRFLKELPVDLIKIDGAFVRDLVRSETDQAMVRSMVDLAHFMGREVIASQVEEKAALDMLRELGADYAQGYAVEKPRLLESLKSR
ncbi:DUF1631 family protein [Marinobacteraceae bacterium S3BR75-40.1]